MPPLPRSSPIFIQTTLPNFITLSANCCIHLLTRLTLLKSHQPDDSFLTTITATAPLISPTGTAGNRTAAATPLNITGPALIAPFLLRDRGKYLPTRPACFFYNRCFIATLLAILLSIVHWCEHFTTLRAWLF